LSDAAAIAHRIAPAESQGNPMTLRPTLTAGALALAVAFTAPAAFAAAPPVLFDSGTPTSGDSYGMALSTVDWLAEEIHLDANTTIGALSTYLAGAQAGETFTIAMYSDRVKNGADIPDTRDGGLLYATQVTFTGNGWNGANGLAWNVAAAGNYWFAIEVADGDTLAATDNALLPIGAPNAPLGVAFTDSSSGRFQSLGAGSSAYAFGLQVSAVPEPSTMALMLAGGLLLVARARRASSRG
jgi:hypothetical protein